MQNPVKKTNPTVSCEVHIIPRSRGSFFFLHQPEEDRKKTNLSKGAKRGEKSCTPAKSNSCWASVFKRRFQKAEHAGKLQLVVAEVLFSPSFSFSVPLCGRDCRLPGCTEVCEITVLRSSSALPERRQSSGSLWHPHSPHTSANLVLIRPFSLSP